MPKGKQIVMDALIQEGVSHIFGNPGTTELPLIDALNDYPQIEYILSLHEGPAVTMADAYAHATGKVGVVNLHVGPGLGNGLGAIYNAWEGKTPLIVTAGQQDNRMRLREPLLWYDLVAMAAPMTKWSVEANHADELPLIMQRAFKVAQETPSGPVFVSLPMNVMEQDTHHAVMPNSGLYPETAPDPKGINHAAELLLNAKKPVIVCGDTVARSGSAQHLVALAEYIGASVYNEVLHAHISFPNQHPHYRERGAADQALIRKLLGDADVVLMVGGDFFEEVWFVDEDPFPAGAKRIQIDPDPNNVAKNYSVDCGIVADIAQVLPALLNTVQAGADTAWKSGATSRREELTELKGKERAQQQQRVESSWTQSPMSVARLMHELNQCLPPDVAVSGEPITASADLMRTLSFGKPGDYLGARSGGIGQGIPSTIGLKLAYPKRPVLGISGDGSALYSIQALWTAAHHRIPVVMIILRNEAYRILKLNMKRYRSEAGVDNTRPAPHLDLSDPVVDYVSIAQGFGVKAQSIEDPDKVQDAVRKAFEADVPMLLDIRVDGRV